MSFDTVTLWVVAATSLAGFVQGLTGFGFGLVSMGLLPLCVSFKEALVIGALLNVVSCATTFATTWRHFVWRHGAGLILGSALGVPVGFYALVHLKPEWLLHGLGAVMCVFSASELFLAQQNRIRFPTSASLPVGLVSGGLGGAFNIGGPPLIAYVYSQPWSKEEIVAVLQVVFGVSALIRVFLVHNAGLLHAGPLQLAGLSVVPMFIAILLGGRLLAWIPREQLKTGVFIFIFALGVKYLFLT